MQAAAIARNAPIAGRLALFALIVGVFAVFRSPISPNDDSRANDRVFLEQVAALVPADRPLFLTGTTDITRLVFSIDRPAFRVWNPDDIAGRAEPPYFVVARTETPVTAADGLCVLRIAPDPPDRSPRRGGPLRFALFQVEDCPEPPAGLPPPQRLPQVNADDAA